MATPIPTSVIDLEHDELTPVRKLAKQLADWDMSPGTLNRVVRKPVRGCRLEAKLVHGSWHTTKRAWAAWVDGQTAAALGNDAPATVPAERSESKKRQLAAAGLI